MTVNSTAFADAVANQWHDLYGPSRAEVPMSVLTAAALRSRLDLSTPQHAPDGVGAFLSAQRRVWERAAQRWPHLYHHWDQYTDWPAWPDREHTTSAALELARRLTATGVIDYLDDLTHRRDFLGGVLYRLRAPLASTGRDPLEAATMRPVHLDRDRPVRSITLERTGTGHGLLPLLAALHEHGVDPRDLAWQLREIDQFQAAVLCTNLACWDVAAPRGANVLVATGQDDDWIQAEREERAESLQTLSMVTDLSGPCP
ncbi:hypothetical protein [Nocardiopsis sp. CNT312]|uniref:hypothetical protein n=1 Tax=Nocardiopsis sp. CNT312 TaxID=1137268 RepID=UPI0004B24318|nr:hypothetical protein [Nocardiopsis sp. CNT312]